jgi:serine/threonine protein kinase
LQVYGVASGLKFLHDNDIVHGDLKVVWDASHLTSFSLLTSIHEAKRARRQTRHSLHL